MKFTLRQLQIFVAIARCGSVSRAAEEVALSQSAASTALTELERAYDTHLFDRVGKRLHLNENGRLLLPRAVELLDRSRELEGVLGGHEEMSDLDIGATLTIGNYLATLLVADFLREDSRRRARLHVANTAHIVQQVLDYQLDLGLIEGCVQHPDLLLEPWIEDELAVFCAPNHPLLQENHITPERLSQQTWILREPGSGTRDTFDHAMYPWRGQLHVRLELQHTEAIKRAVESGLGISCISRLALRDAFRRGSLVQVPVEDLNLRRHFHFVQHRNKYPSPGLRSFLAYCRQLTAHATTSDEIPLPPIP